MWAHWSRLWPEPRMTRNERWNVKTGQRNNFGRGHTRQGTIWGSGKRRQIRRKWRRQPQLTSAQFFFLFLYFGCTAWYANDNEPLRDIFEPWIYAKDSMLLKLRTSNLFRGHRLKWFKVISTACFWHLCCSIYLLFHVLFGYAVIYFCVTVFVVRGRCFTYILGYWHLIEEKN